MSKKAFFTEEAAAFANTLEALSRKKLNRMLDLLEKQGYLRAPMAEKVRDNLFALRVMTAGNERFFYCYDDGTIVYILSGYEKKTARIPEREIGHALAIRKGLGL